MRQNHNYCLPRIGLSFAFVAVLMWSATSLFAQKTVVQDAGGGRKLELDYNAAGQVTQQRTLAADGKLQQKVDYQHRPGYYVADQTRSTELPRPPTMPAQISPASSSRTSTRPANKSADIG